MYTDFALSAACAYGYVFWALSELCVRIRILRFKRLVRTDTDYQFLQRLGGSLLRICLFVWRTNETNIEVRWFIWRLCDGHDGPPGGSVRRMWSSGLFHRQSVHSDWTVFIILLRVLSKYLFNVVHMIHRPTLTLEFLLLSNNMTRCSNITVHYAHSM